MQSFINKHAHSVIGTLSGFDRLVFRGTLRFLSHHKGMVGYLYNMGVRLKDFAAHAQEVTGRLRQAPKPWRFRPDGRSAIWVQAPSTRNRPPATLPRRTASRTV
nr:hypothetical protein [uncultured Rhodopila sp.]